VQRLHRSALSIGDAREDCEALESNSATVRHQILEIQIVERHRPKLRVPVLPRLSLSWASINLANQPEPCCCSIFPVRASGALLMSALTPRDGGRGASEAE